MWVCSSPLAGPGSCLHQAAGPDQGPRRLWNRKEGGEGKKIFEQLIKIWLNSGVTMNCSYRYDSRGTWHLVICQGAVSFRPHPFSTSNHRISCVCDLSAMCSERIKMQICWIWRQINTQTVKYWEIKDKFCRSKTKQIVTESKNHGKVTLVFLGSHRAARRDKILFHVSTLHEASRVSQPSHLEAKLSTLPQDIKMQFG